MLLVTFPLLLVTVLSLFFVILITVYLGVFLCGLILYGTLHFLDFSDCFLSQVREILSCFSSNIFSSPFSLSLSSFWDPYNANTNVVNVVSEVS